MMAEGARVIEQSSGNGRGTRQVLVVVNAVDVVDISLEG